MCSLPNHFNIELVFQADEPPSNILEVNKMIVYIQYAIVNSIPVNISLRVPTMNEFEDGKRVLLLWTVKLFCWMVIFLIFS